MGFQSVFSSLVLLSLAVSVFSQCLTQNDDQPTNEKAKMQLSEGRMNFSLRALGKIAKIETQNNIFFSPHSLHQAFSLMYFGAKDATEEKLKKVLGIPKDMTKTDVKKLYSFEKLEEQSDDASNYELKIANRLWISDSKVIKDCMLSFFRNELEKTNFKSDPNGARIRINDWVSNITKGNIRDLIPDKTIDSSTDLVLANAIYFKGMWQSKFNVKDSTKKLFYASSNSTVFTSFMSQKGLFNYTVSEELRAHILELPYKARRVSMYVLLPPYSRSDSRSADSSSSNGNLEQLIHLISTETGYSYLKNALENDMTLQSVEVVIPKFRLERDLPVKELLNALDAGEILSKQANLRGFLEKNQGDLHLGDAVHRAKIEVSEEGTVASAATAIFSFRSSRPSEPVKFVANHPFLYLIYDNVSKSILFAGVYRKPMEKEEVA